MKGHRQEASDSQTGKAGKHGGFSVWETEEGEEMRSITRYPGSKWSLAKWIINQFPPHHSYLDGWEWPECALLPVEGSKRKPVAYIAGAITGLDDYQKTFLRAKSTLEGNGYNAINPAELKSVLHAEASYEDYMDICLMLVKKSDFLVLLPGWEKSPGANRELGYAKGLDKIVLTLEEICETTNTGDTPS